MTNVMGAYASRWPAPSGFATLRHMVGLDRSKALLATTSVTLLILLTIAAGRPLAAPRLPAAAGAGVARAISALPNGGRLGSKVVTVSMASLAAAGGIAPITVRACCGGAQLVFIDSLHLIYSIYLSGYNQNGNYAFGCWNTPQVYNYVSGWWWESLKIDMYLGYNCGYDPANKWYGAREDDPGYISVTNWFCVDDSLPPFYDRFC